jgi:hypothetical protein
MIEFGTESTTYRIGNAMITKIQKFRDGEEAIALKHYRTRVKVRNSQEEMTEFIKFSNELSQLRSEGKLMVDREDPSTRPAFVFEYPKEDRDGGYFVIKCFTILS